MKKKLLMIALCFCITAAFAQKKETTVTLDINPDRPDSIWVGGYGEVFFAKPGKDNKIVLKLQLDAALSLRVGVDKPEKKSLTMFLEPGDQLNVATDLAKKTTFTGKGSGNANVFFEINQAFMDAYLKIDARKLTPSELFDKALEMGQQSIDILEKNKQKVTPSFYQRQSVTLYYNRLSFAFAPGAPIPYLYQAGLGKKASESVPDHYWDIQKYVKLDEKLMGNPEYSSFVKFIYPMFLNYKTKSELGLLDSTLSAEANAKLTLGQVEKIYSGKMRSITLESIISSLLAKVKDVATVKPIIDNFNANYGSPEDAKSLQETYEKYEKLAAGKTPPAFVLKGQDGKEVTLKDFAGKVVYMDFWASWCSPCRYEMKNGSPKLHAKFKDNKDVVFLYISLDSKVADWKKAIADDKIEGLHFLSQAKSGVNSPAASAFNINGIPHYVIIGKDGKIFDNDAPRPSEDKTPARINEALSAK